MQEVFKDGIQGSIRDLDMDLLKKLLESEEVDHVKIFDKETGNKVKIADIEEAELNRKIDDIVEAKFSEVKKKEDEQVELELLKKTMNKQIAQANR